MSYLTIKPLLAQYNTKSKVLCVAQCTRLSATCNIAVFNPTATPHCALHGEPFSMTNLIPSTDATVIDSGRNHSNRGCISSTGIAVMASYNLITFGNLNIVSGVYNRTIVCGSLISTSSAQFAKTINSSVFPATADSLEINQQIGSGNPIQVLAGSLSISTNFTHTITTTDSTSYILDGRTVLLRKGDEGARIHINANLTSKCMAIEDNIKVLSNELLGMIITPGNNISIPTSTVAPLQFYVNRLDPSGMAVFNIDGNTVLNNPLVEEIQVVVDSSITHDTELVVINLSGTSISFSEGNMAGIWLSSASPGRSQTIWNFYQGTSITLSRTWMGALLAPYALVTASTHIDGMTAVRSLVTSADIRDSPIIVPSCV